MIDKHFIILIHKNKNDLDSFINNLGIENEEVILNIEKIILHMYKLKENAVSSYFSGSNKKVFDLLTNGIKDVDKISLNSTLIKSIVKSVRQIYDLIDQYPVIVAVHWGGFDDQTSQSYTNKFNADLDNDNIASIRFAHFSNTPTNWTNWDDLKGIFYNQIWGSSKQEVELENLKKQVYNHWLPLAINMRGLSDVEESKRAQYYEDIKKDIQENRNTLKADWDKIEPKVRIIVDTLAPYSIVDNIYLSDNIELFCSKYSKSEKPFLLLPNWLESVVKEIDQKIAEIKK